ncbi:hypothetical protein GWI33_013301 [Rhynchophorus ferrugineus]|uniref:Uncharacterized protein n=1 Tax=Rhynchophorus ferrugineus TaxID=354439 RepID=A0A834I7B2_RHYFE|nr:hypothetical protein GWI33_013301 [Rhynchophorus ferrugineus]
MSTEDGERCRRPKEMIKRNKPDFCVAMRQWMTIQSTSPIDSHPSELHTMNPLQSVEKCNSRLARLWRLEKGRTINSDYYIALLDPLKSEIK